MRAMVAKPCAETPRKRKLVRRSIVYRAAIGYKEITPDQLREIVAAPRLQLVRNEALLRSDIDESARSFIANHHLQNGRAPAAIAKQLAKIERACSRTLAAFECRHPGGESSAAVGKRLHRKRSALKRLIAALEIRNDDSDSIPFDLSSPLSQHRAWLDLRDGADKMLALRDTPIAVLAHGTKLDS